MMSEDSFAFIIHPIDPQRDVSRKFPTLGKLPVWLIDFLSLFFPPVYISEIRGIQSQANGRFLHGWFIACPLTPKRMMTLPANIVYRKIIQSGRLAERLGAKILGLGAFTSVVGDAGITIARNLDLPVTTGDSYTIAVAVEAIEEAARLLNISLATATVAVVGASGTIGSVCTQLLAGRVAKLILIGRRQDKLEEVATKTKAIHDTDMAITAEMNQLTQANLVITVTSAIDTVIEPQHLRRGAIVCDVARPRDISLQVAQQRPDVLVIEGGMVTVPGEVDFGFNFGFPPGMAYACMAETMALALEQRYECFTLGKDIALSQVLTIDKIATKHGFQLGGFRSFERAITDTEIAQIKAHSQSSETIHHQAKVSSQQPVGSVPL